MGKRLALRSLAAVISVACGDSVSVTEPTPSPQAPLYYLKAPTNDGDGQSDTALATLASPFRVLVRRGDIPAPGITVLWQMAPDTLRGIPGLAVSTVTDAEGIASYTLTLGGAAPYTYAVRASLPGVFTPAPVVIARGLPCGSALCFTATAKPGKPTSLRIVSGNNQTDATNMPLLADYVVQATDRHGNGVPGVLIDWAVTGGGGSITPTQSTTMAPNGYAAARHTLGPEAGTHSAKATASALQGAPQVTFTSIPFGSLQVTTTTTGVDLDQNGYGVGLDGATRDTGVSVGNNTNATISRLTPGDYRVTLGGVAMNCDFDPGTPNPRTITVPSGGTAVLAFDVACAPVPLLAFVGDADGNAEIYTIKVNGAAATRLTTNPEEDAVPAWSPDGTRIAFTSNRDGKWGIYVMNADGTNVMLLREGGGDPAWSPDGSKIAFEESGEIYVMNADGTNVMLLREGGGHPAWSPDGSKIAFEGGSEIYVMNADGSGVTLLTYGAEPAWSPDGTKLAFTRGGDCSVYFQYPCAGVVVVNADGSGEFQVQGLGYDINPAWSPDGRWIAVASVPCGWDDSGPYYEFRCYGPSSITVILADPAYAAVYDVPSPGVVGSQPAWRP